MTSLDPKLATALGALTDLIEVTIKSDDPGRFAVAARMCQTAHTLARGSATRVDDFEQNDDGAYARGGQMMNPMRMARGPLSEGDIVREAMATAMPLVERYSVTQIAQAEQAEAQTLAALLSVRDHLPDHAATLDARVATLLTKITERNSKHALVPAELLRGHQAGEHRERLPLDPGATDDPGAAGGEEAPQTRASEVVGHVVGNGGRLP